MVCLQANLMEAIPPLKLPLPSLCQVDKSNLHKHHCKWRFHGRTQERTEVMGWANEEGTKI